MLLQRPDNDSVIIEAPAKQPAAVKLAPAPKTVEAELPVVTCKLLKCRCFIYLENVYFSSAEQSDRGEKCFLVQHSSILAHVVTYFTHVRRGLSPVVCRHFSMLLLPHNSVVTFCVCVGGGGGTRTFYSFFAMYDCVRPLIYGMCSTCSNLCWNVAY